jgi:hypothetical protein
MVEGPPLLSVIGRSDVLRPNLPVQKNPEWRFLTLRIMAGGAEFLRKIPSALPNFL